MGKALFSVVEVKRLVNAARDAGLPVDRMGLHVDKWGIHLLPPANGPVSDEPELDAELGAWRARGNG